MTKLSYSVIFLALLLFLAPFAKAQGTYTAASCTESAIAAAISSEQAHPVDGDIISIPSGSCTWTGSTVINQTFNNSVTIQGAGAQSATTGGASLTGSDVTVIVDNTSTGNPAMTFTTATGKSFRLTGMAIKGSGSSTPKDPGVVAIRGSSSAVRVDHCHFYVPTALNVGLYITGSVTGVADHLYFQSDAQTLNNPMAVQNGAGWNGVSSDQFGDASWNDTENWGTSGFFYFEDSYWQDGDIGDGGGHGSRYVLRHNTIAVTSVCSSFDCGIMYDHGLTSDRRRSQRAAEVYDNVFTQPGSIGANNPAYALNSGSLLFWGNTVTGYREAVMLGYDERIWSSNGNYVYSAPPNGWGLCGTARGPSGWDQNSNSSGYACMDQPGRGKGDLLSGDFSSICNLTQNPSCNTFTGQWPRQALSPIYIWGNNYTPAGGYSGNEIVALGDNASTIVSDNREFYQQFGTYGESGSFNGTKGVGQGLLSARPSTCTAGNSSLTTLYNLAGQAPGVAYWATDTNTLYVCTAANTWTAYYTPYTYPHPLANGGGATVAPPTNVSVVVQ